MLKRLAFMLLLFSGLAHANLPLHTDLPLKYVEKAAAQTAGKPLVILMHGYGSNELDLFAMYTGLPEGYTYLSVRAPITLGPGRFQWFRQTPNDPNYNGETADLLASAQTLRDFISQAASKYRTPAKQVFLVGFSQGAMMSYEVALREPGSVGGIAALSGKMLPVLRTELKDTRDFAGLDVFIGHGTADRMIPLAGGTQADQFLQQRGLVAQMHIYTGLPHSISPQEVGDLKAWLEARTSSAY